MGVASSMAYDVGLFTSELSYHTKETDVPVLRPLRLVLGPLRCDIQVRVLRSTDVKRSDGLEDRASPHTVAGCSAEVNLLATIL